MTIRKKKCLFLNFHNSKHPFFETSLELMELNREECEIYSLYCNGLLDKYCCNHVRHQKFNRDYNYCNKCKREYLIGMELVKVSPQSRFVLKEVEVPQFPDFNTIDEIKNFSIDGANIGFGIASTIMTYTRDYKYNPHEQKELIQKLFTNSYTILQNLEKLHSQIKFDEIYLFNGRYYEFNTGVAFARKHNIDFYIYESGADHTRYRLRKNDYIHDFKCNQQEILDLWNAESDTDKKIVIAEEYPKNRRNRVEKNWWGYTKKQKYGVLPANFDKTKENIVIYNGSLDEISIFDEYKNPIDANENNIIRNIIKHYENNTDKHFYLRIHPNISNLRTTQMKELEEIIASNPKCMTIIRPEEDIDTYALMDACDKVLVFCSTMGIESTYWGKVSILAGVALYDHLDCIYKAITYDELWKFLDSKELTPKPKENAYPYFYWMNTFGIPHKIYKPERLFVGTFRGVNLKELGHSMFTRTYRGFLRKLGLRK